MKLYVEYNSNNSGGSWWLRDKDWVALEKKGWTVEWGGTYFCHSKSSFDDRPKGMPQPCKSYNKCRGHRRYTSFKAVGKDRWLGCAARGAYKEFTGKDTNDCLIKAIREFEKVTGQDLSDEGCNCCGSPHTFNYGQCHKKCSCKGPHKDYNWVSGEGFLGILAGDRGNMSKRDLLGV